MVCSCAHLSQTQSLEERRRKIYFDKAFEVFTAVRMRLLLWVSAPKRWHLPTSLHGTETQKNILIGTLVLDLQRTIHFCAYIHTPKCIIIFINNKRTASTFPTSLGSCARSVVSLVTTTVQLTRVLSGTLHHRLKLTPVEASQERRVSIWRFVTLVMHYTSTNVKSPFKFNTELFLSYLHPHPPSLLIYSFRT
jgi:hypothetical protein